ncbi:AT DNA binding protein [Aspergillus bombycis]|uniref:AT DNA binding protein n=1 Tax=Aspergillus bombycis TaxID=109264 RepID=A0A1F8AIK6_9EURO|nr:AT DNA binding protein [Aspergillus bombycis]OGM51148.1 AT DNA binding protein [Aspergillus bombycis]
MDGGMQLQTYEGFGDPDAPLLPWDEIYQKVLLSPRFRPSLLESSLATSQLTSLLSASSYPIPEPFYQHGQFPPEGYGASLPVPNGFLLSGSSADGERMMSLDRRTPPIDAQRATQNAQKTTKRQLNESSDAPTAKKRGRPRKTMDIRMGEDPEERRRMQIRLAQRAYRSRKEANITSLKGRISQLEATLEKMSSAVVSFSDNLVQSGALSSHPDIASHLRDTVQTCLALAKEASKDGEPESPDTSSHGEDSTSSASAGPDGTSTDHNTSPRSHAEQTTPPESGPSKPISPSLSEPLEPSAMDIPLFIEQLHLACVYQGYLVLSNPSVPMSRIERPFRFLFTLMDRPHLTAAFEALLHAKLSQKRLEECYAGVPFFKLGGAGTHYERSTGKAQEGEKPLCRYQQWATIHDPLARFSPEIRQEMEGDWFDMQDLAGYLREKGVRLFSSAPSETDRKSARTSINVTRFTQTLISRGICLGRTPGFRRSDVDSALHVSVWT